MKRVHEKSSYVFRKDGRATVFRTFIIIIWDWAPAKARTGTDQVILVYSFSRSDFELDFQTFTLLQNLLIFASRLQLAKIEMYWKLCKIASHI